MKITHIETLPITVGIDPEIMITSSLGTHRVSRYVLVKVHTDEGITGIGEATVMPMWSGETQGGAKILIDEYLTSALQGEDPFNLEFLVWKMERAAVGNPFSKAALEMALLDLIGKKLRVPVYHLLGGRCRSERIPIKFVVAATEPEIAIRNAEQMVERGFTMIKIKVGRDPKADVERVRRVREALGETIRLSVDANGGWTVADAIWAIRQMEPYDLVTAEQPVQKHDLDGMAQVRRSVGVPIMADESVFTEREAIEVIRREAADIISVYPGKNGGILRARAIVKIAEAAGIPCHMGSNLEWDVGSSAMAHLAVSTRNIVSERYPADILGPLYHVDHVVTSPLRIEKGYVEVPSRPGLGVELDEEKIRALNR